MMCRALNLGASRASPFGLSPATLRAITLTPLSRREGRNAERSTTELHIIVDGAGAEPAAFYFSGRRSTTELTVHGRIEAPREPVNASLERLVDHSRDRRRTRTSDFLRVKQAL